MSKENVTDFKVCTETNFLSISQDGQIEIPLSLEALDRLLGGCYLEETRVSDKNLVLLAKEILSLRLRNTDLHQSLCQSLGVPPAMSQEMGRTIRSKNPQIGAAHKVTKQLRDKFSKDELLRIVNQVLFYDFPIDPIQVNLLVATTVLNHTIAFLEQNNEPNTD